jgi:hypothetical protein
LWINCRQACNSKLLISKATWKYQAWTNGIAVCNIASFIFYLKCIILTCIDKGYDFTTEDIFFMVVFSLDMIFNFLVESEAESPTDDDTVKDISNSAKLYLKGEFCIDLLTILPFHSICKQMVTHSEFFLLLKVLRMRNHNIGAN